MISPESRELFQRLVDAAQRIVLVTHIQPDGDALGSQVSLGRFLGARGKPYRTINNDATQEILQYVEDPERPVEVYDPVRHDAELAASDLLILVDNSAPDRLGRMELAIVDNAERVLCIDHHPTRDAPWKHNIVDVDACATTAVIYELVRGCGWTPDLTAAQAIFVGLATDTGFFRFNSTNACGLRIAADLLDLGIEPASNYEAIYERNSEAYTRLLGSALDTLAVRASGALVSVTITQAIVERLQASDVDTSEITTSLLAMDRVRLALLFRELPGERVKISLRSKGQLDVHRLATEFGGGGHRNASGIVMDGPLERAVDLVTRRAEALV